MKSHLALALTLLLTCPVGAAPATRPVDPLTAGEQRWSKAARQIVDQLDHSQADQVYAHSLSQGRRADTTKAAFEQMIHSVNVSLGPVTQVTRLPKLDGAPVGGLLGIPSNDVVQREEKSFADKYYDTIWSLTTKGGGKNYLLMTLVAEGGNPRILWLEYIGEGIRTPEYAAVEKASKQQATDFLNKLLDDKREDIVDHDLSKQFLRRLPRDHMMSLLDDVRHHVGAVGGVQYAGGWVQHEPQGVTVDFRQKDTPAGKEPYEVLIRLSDEDGKNKVDALGDEWDTGAKKKKKPKSPWPKSP